MNRASDRAAGRMHNRSAWVAVIALEGMTVSCGGAQSPRRVDHTARDVQPSQQGADSNGSSRAPASAPLVQRFEQLAQALAPRGVHFDGVVASGFITHGTNITTPIDVPANQCLSIIALASSSIHDLDAHLFGPDGDVVVEDIETDPHPTVQLCATTAVRRVYHVIETYVSDQSASEGHGAYAVGLFRSDRAGLEAVARAIGGHPGTALSSGANASDGERRLIELRQGIARRGFQPDTDTLRASFPTVGAIRYPFAVVPDRCYTFAALAEGSLSDADLRVFDPDGEEIARDIRPERDAFVQLCPAAAEMLQVEVRARPGSGVVLLQSFAADAAQLGGANTLWLGERIAWRASATPLAQSIESVRASLESRGYSHATVPVSFSLAPGEARSQRISVEAGRCTAIAAAIGRGLGRVSLEAHAASGDFVARGVFGGAATIAVVCSSARADLQLHLRADVGSGEAAIFQATTGPAPAWASGVDPVAVSESLASLLAMVDSGWHADGAADRMRLGARALRVREADLVAGICSRFVVSAGGGLPAVSLALRAANGNVVARAAADGTSTVTYCAAAAEHVRLEVTIDPPGPSEFDAFLVRYSRRGGAR